MMRNIKVLKRNMVVIFVFCLMFGAGMAINAAPVAAAPGDCFTQTNDFAGQPATIYNVGPCPSRDVMRDGGFVVRGMDNPFDATKCYFWTNDATAPGRVVDCNNPRFAEAPGRGSAPRVPPLGQDDLPDPNLTPPGDGSLEQPTRDSQDCAASNSCLNNNYIVVMAKWAVNILSAAVAVVVVGVIVFAGIEYSSSGGDPGKTAVAKKRIVNAIIALVAYMFLFVAFQWLIPGGLFKS